MSDIFCLMQSASPASLASFEAKSPSAEMLRDCGVRMELDTPLTRPFSFLNGVCKNDEFCFFIILTFSFTSGADLLPCPGRGSIITSVKLLARSSVELPEDTARAS